ncbi:MAG: hypothetical protein ABIR32_14475 [Ilumatobacteraceae bacterium]
MTTAVIMIGPETTTVSITDADPDGDTPSAYVIPRGMQFLHRAHITADPPLPENLTNAIGDMMDHLDDAARELPALGDVDTVIVTGPAAMAIAAVEIGSAIRNGDVVLGRDAVEDVFRTLATETAEQRRHNPGLPSDLVDVIPAGCCAVVAVLRSLQLGSITVPG